MPKDKFPAMSVAKGAIFATLCMAALCVPSVAFAENVASTTTPQESPAPATQNAAANQTGNVDATPQSTPAVETLAATENEPSSDTAGDEAPTSPAADTPAASSNDVPSATDNDASSATGNDVPAAAGDDAPDVAEGDIQAAAAANVSYDYNAAPYSPTGNEADSYPGVYTATLQNNAGTQDPQTIGFPSIADANLPDAPTTESPAIIQGAAVGYEQKTGAVEYTKIKDRDEPYSDFTYKILEEKGPDGTTRTGRSVAPSPPRRATTRPAASM